MRLKKGSKVEVLNEIGAPSGSWRCAEIISGNGHTYTVRYEGREGSIGATVVERIPRKAIRPCPPLPEIAENWAPGDVVEVFDDLCWKMATISKVLGRNQFLARIPGSTLEFKASKFGIRRRQSWQNRKWIILGKASGSYEGTEHDENSTLKCNENSQDKVQMMNARFIGGFFPMRNKEKVQEVVSCRTLKRGPYGREQLESAVRKFRAVEKEGRMHRAVAANQCSFAEELDDVAFPKDMVGEILRPSFYSQTVFAAMNVEGRKHSNIIGCSSAIRLEPNSEDSVTSSVGSCSMTSNNYYRIHHHAGFVADDGDHSDAESFCQRACDKGNNSLPTGDKLAAEIRRLELHAYRCTMEALYASGPLSWEQEELVTNLRLSLHISNDEHLMEGLSRKALCSTSFTLLKDVAARRISR